MSEDAYLATAWVQQPGEHLQGGGLAGAVRSEKPDDLARSHVERNAIDRGHFAGLPCHQAAQRGERPCFALLDRVDLAQLTRANRGLGDRRSLHALEYIRLHSRTIISGPH